MTEDKEGQAMTVVTTRDYIKGLMEDLGGEEVTLGRALDIVERALKTHSFQEGALQAAKEALKLVIEALDKEDAKLKIDLPPDN